MLLFSALEAYNVGPVPFTWIGQVSAVAFFIWAFLREKKLVIPGIKLTYIYLIWAIIITAWYYIEADYEELMPSKATLPYWGFISLRLLNISAFIATIYITSLLLEQGYKNRLMKWLVVLGTLESLASVYIYLAQVYGLPEPTRNRIGTDGGEQITTFSYEFHRAMGTFREPSHLAEWLVVPLFVCLTSRKKIWLVCAFLISSAILLSGSLTGILGGVFGYIVAGISSGFFNSKNIKIQLSLVLIAVVSLYGFNKLAASNSNYNVDLIETIESRIVPIIYEGGVQKTNRDYVYEYFSSQDIPLLGYGLGNANLLFTQYLDWQVVSSFLSLYIYSLHSLGVPGFCLLLIVLFRPVALFWLGRKQFNQISVIPIMAAYFAWLVMFALRSEEFSFIFAVVWAIVGYELHQHSKYVENYTSEITI